MTGKSFPRLCRDGNRGNGGQKQIYKDICPAMNSMRNLYRPIYVLRRSGAVKNIQVNGKSCNFSSNWYVDKSIGVIPIAEYAKEGINTIELFFEEPADNIRTPEALVQENEIARNLFSYEMEIENIYVLGSFSVKVDNFTLNKNVFYAGNGSFTISQEKKIEKGNLTAQGFWFIAGELPQKIKFPIEKKRKRVYFPFWWRSLFGDVGSEYEKIKDILLYEKTDVSEYGGQYVNLF